MVLFLLRFLCNIDLRISYFIREQWEIMRMKHFTSQSDQGFKGTVVNRALISLNKGSHKIPLTVPLKSYIHSIKCMQRSYFWKYSFMEHAKIFLVPWDLIWFWWIRSRTLEQTWWSFVLIILKPSIALYPKYYVSCYQFLWKFCARIAIKLFNPPFHTGKLKS